MNASTPTTPTVESFDERVKREYTEKHQAMSALYLGVAKALGAPWKPTIQPNIDHQEERPQYDYELADTQGHRLSLRIGVYSSEKGKVMVSSYWPHRQNSAYTSPRDVNESLAEIGVSMSRGYEAIAKEIERRYLPEYFRIYALIQARLDEREAYQLRKAEGWKRIVATGLVIKPKDGDEDRDAHGDIKTGKVEYHEHGYTMNHSQGYGDIRMTSENSVEIKLSSLPVETAIRVLKAIQGGE